MSSREPNDSDETAALLRARHEDESPARHELDARLHREKMRAHFAEVTPDPVAFRRWTILRKLGQGGMGAVYLAGDPRLGRRVALKLLGEPGHAPPRDVTREARALAAIHHEHVVQVFSVDDSSPATVVIEMEYVDGETLRSWAGGRGWREVVAVLADVGDGLAELHRAGLLHRDIKPANILVDAAGKAKLADFGLAVAADRPQVEGPPHAHTAAKEASPLEVRMTARGALLGTLGYIAPEVMAGDEATRASDLFGLASVLFEGLFGVLPFRGDSPAELAAAIRSGSLNIPKDAPKLPGWLTRSLRRALSADPAARHASVAEFARGLRRGLARRRLLLAALAFVAAASALPILGWYLGPTPPDPCAEAGNPMAALVAGSRPAAALGEFGDGGHYTSVAELLRETIAARRDAWIAADIRLCATSRRRPLLDVQALIREEQRRRCLDETLATYATLLETRPSPRPPADLIAALEAVPTCDDAFLTHRRPGPPTDARAKLDRALTLELGGERDRAEDLARSVAEGDYPPYERAEAFYRLGHVLGGERRMTQATAALDEARDLAFASGYDDLYCRAAAHQAKLAANVSLSPEASRRDLRAATACLERTGSRSPVLHGDLLEARGLLAHTAGQLDEAIARHREALELRRARLGMHHPDVAKSQHNLGTALQVRDAEGDREAALRHYRAAAITFRAALGDDALLLADVLVDLGCLHSANKQDDEAVSRFTEALAIYERNTGDNHVSLAKVRTGLAQLALRREDFNAAAAHLDHAREHHEVADLPADHDDRLLRLETEGRLAAHQGHFTAAEQRYSEALALRRDELTTDELDVLAEWVEAASAVGKTSELVAQTVAAGSSLVDRLNALTDAERRAALAWYAAAALHDAGRMTEASAYYEVALAAYESLDEPPLEHLAELRWKLAQTLSETSTATSRPLAESAIEAYTRLGDRAHATAIARWLDASTTHAPSPSPHTP